MDFVWSEQPPTHYDLATTYPSPIISFVLITNHDPTSKLLEFLDPWIKHYPWPTASPPVITMQSHFYTTVTNEPQTIPYIYGELTYASYTPDAHLFIHLLILFSTYTQCYIHFFDSNVVDPICVLCHDVIEDESLDNMVWIHNGDVITLNRHSKTWLCLRRAVWQIYNGDYTASPWLTNKLKEGLGELEDSLKRVFDLRISLPGQFARAVVSDPLLVTKAMTELEEGGLQEDAVIGGQIQPVTVCVNTVTYSAIVAISHELDGEFNTVASRLLTQGLSRYFNKHSMNTIPSEQGEIITRYTLQDILIGQGILRQRVPQQDHSEMVNQMYKPDDEQALADTLQKILDPDYVHESLSDELEMFRSRYYDASGTWLDEDEVADKYEQFKNGMRATTDLSAFQDSEFDDFPEFLEREVMLSLKYNDDSDYVSEEDDDYVDDGDDDVDVEVHDDEYEPPKIEEMQEYTPTESELRSYVNGDIEVENLTRVLRDLKTGESATTLEQMLQRQYKQ